MGKQKIGNKVGIQSSGAYQWALDFDGSTEYLSCTPALRLTGEYSLYDNFSDGNYDGWTVSSGAYSVVDSTPLSGGTKALKCTTAGIISIPCNQAYGQWEFDWYKGGDANESRYFIVQNIANDNITTTQGYRIQAFSDERIYISKHSPSGQLAYTNTSYISNNTWYRFKITRNTNGQFYLYIKGGSFGSDYVLVSVTGGSGTNPATDNTYTSSNYFVLDLDANDMISNIVCQQGEGSLDLNSYERIYHSNNRAFEDTTGFRWATNGTHSIVRNTDATTGSNLIPDSASTFGIGSGGVTWWGIGNGTIVWGSSDSSLKVSASSQASYINKTLLTAGYTYKFTYKVKSSSYTGKIIAYGGTGTDLKYSPDVTSSWQTVTGFFKTDNNTFYLQAGSSYTGDIFFDSIIVQKLEGRTGYSGKLISTDVGDSTTNYISLPAVNFDTLKTDANGIYEKYTLEFWVKSKALSRVIVKVGNQVKTSDTISNIAFEKVVFNFQSNALVSNQPILLYVNQADTVYLDDVSLTKGYDVLINTFAKHTANANQDYLFARGGNSSTTNGYNLYINTSNNFLTAISGGTTQTLETNTTSIGLTNYYLQSSFYDRIGNQINYVNGVTSTGTSLTNMGKIINTATFYIGTLSGTGTDDWAGSIGHFRIIKFTDIAQSNVSAINLVSAYNLGKLKTGTWIGGSPIEVAFYDWKGSTTNEILSDKSGTGNNLTGTNMDINDRVKVKSKFK